MLGRAMQQRYLVESGSSVNLHDLYRFSEANPFLPSIKPMHEKYGQFGNSYAGQKVILLVRDPRDAVVSRYHQHRDTLPFETLESYVKESDDLSDYIQFYNDWQQYRDRAQSLLVVRYEDLKANTHPEVTRIFCFLNVSITADEVQQAIDYASFKNMRKMEVDGSQQVRAGVMSSRDVNQPDSFKVRKGTIGGYRSELSDKAIALIDTTVQQQLNPVYGYH